MSYSTNNPPTKNNKNNKIENFIFPIRTYAKSDITNPTIEFKIT